MREVIAAAEVGDAVIDTDPTVDRLEKQIAARLGKAAAIFMPSGTMTNQVALRLHCRPGDEFICETDCHIYHYEQGAYAQLSGLATRPLAGEDCVLWRRHLEHQINPDNEHCVRTRLLCLENTHNRGAGRVLPLAAVQEACAWAREHDLACHLDGARLFNAVVASGVPAEVWSEPFDTVSICFSKGLGAPVGSALIGSAAHIREARRHRKLFGGGMRQAGVLAAAALYALDHHVDRLQIDHEHAQLLASAVREAPGLRLARETVDTNMVIFSVLGTAEAFVAALSREGVAAIPMGRQIVRLVTHLDVNADDVRQAAEILIRVAHATA